MSSIAFDAPLTLELRPSAHLRAALLALHVLAVAGLCMLPWLWIVMGVSALSVSMALEWRRTGCRQRLRWRADGGWEQPGSAAVSQLHGSTFVSARLIVLALHDGRRVRRWALCADAMAEPTWRRMRARLRVQGAALAAVAEAPAAPWSCARR
jgi:hypothetical protein